MTELDQLEKSIIDATFRYYKGETLSMTDKQFDDALEDLRKLDPDHWILKTTGWGFHPDDSVKVAHLGKCQVGSLTKIKHPEPIPTHHDYQTLIMPKLDGLSIVTTASLGDISAVTRGDGKFGVDVTDKLLVLLTESCRDKLRSHPGVFSCRGEVIVNSRYEKEVVEKFGLPPGAGALRNFAAGVMNRKEVSEDLKYLSYVTYFIRIDSHTEYKNHLEMFTRLDYYDFDTCSYWLEDEPTPEQFEGYYKTSQATYPVDGLVFAPLQPFQHKTDFTFYESEAIAYKFQGDTAEVVIAEVQWETGSAGRLAPTAVLSQPVELSGAKIQRVSCHHASYVREEGIGAGAVVEIIRANEVIPYITKVIAPNPEPVIPENCPSCATDVQWIGREGAETYLYCPNIHCPSKSHAMLHKFFKVCGIPKGLADKTIEDYLSEFPISNTYDDNVAEIKHIFDLMPHFKQLGAKNTAMRHTMLKKKFKDHYGTLLWELEMNIELKMRDGFTAEEFWLMLNLPGLGPSAAIKMSKFCPTELKKSAVVEVLGPSDVPQPVIDTVYEHFTYWVDVLNALPGIKRAEKSDKPQLNLKVSITGKISVPRPEYVSKLRLYGITAGGISKNTDYLICDKPSSSSKFKKAEELGVKIITEVDFEKLLTL